MDVLPDGYLDVAAGKLANVVTNLEMPERPLRRPDPPGVRAVLRRDRSPDPAQYRALFHNVGDAYLWSSRLALDDAALRAILDDEAVEVYAVEHDGSDEGLLELDFREPETCEIAFFGVTEGLIGSGAGRWLMNRAIDIAWSKPIRRLWVHTCTLDHPGAVAFYIRSGFVPYKRQVEVCDDPRLTGLVRRDAAPHVPLI
jgi:GNAT superfamily N-acetyltransferase